MKKLTLLSICFGTSVSLFSQELPPETSQITLSKEQLLQKSKHQKTAAIVLLCAGGVAATVGLAMAADGLDDELEGLFNPNYEGDNDETVSTILFFTGAAAMLGSIPLFISSRKNKGRAMELSFKNIPSSQVYKNMLVNQRIPSINLRIRL